MMRILLLVGIFFATVNLHAADGLIVMKSAHSVAATLDRFERTLRARGMTVFARVDHSAGAAGAGLELRLEQLLIFGNPKLGTLLMQSRPTAGIDLPMKALAWKDDSGQVWLAYNDPRYLAARHGISDRGPVIEKMRRALASLSKQAAE
ncbi:MAG TPA: DUF302 domain-containing protein [Gammaproteobacteria bacterium]|nr:DUF302 domain-containing protein [Gammaproteobacteria bacterium]